MRADYHIHTTFSCDGHCSMEQAVQRSIALGFDEICFTEHLNYGIENASCDSERYWEEFLCCNAKYEKLITLRFGIEFGMQRSTIEAYEKTFSTYPYDFVLLSCHQIDNLEFWNQQFQAGKSQREYNERYYAELLVIMQQFKHYSVLAHLDVIRRYDRAGEYPFTAVKDIIAEILKLAITDGKGLEVNTSCYRYKLSDLTPCCDILSLYRTLGGHMLTLGSDAHRIEQIGFQIEEVRRKLKQLGFLTQCTFQQMNPTFYPL